MDLVAGLVPVRFPAFAGMDPTSGHSYYRFPHSRGTTPASAGVFFGEITMQLTLSDLVRLKSIMAIQRLCSAAGLEKSSMRSRIKRGAPELTREESDAMLAAMERVGLHYVPEASIRDHS